jgi:hypothetical protein
MDIGTITEIKKVDDGLECRVDMGAGLVETAVLFGTGGHFEYPMIDDEVAIQMASDDNGYSGAQNVIVAVFRATPDGLSSGESIMYSRDSAGSVVGSVKCNGNGKVIINDGTRSAVGFSDLKSGFDELKDDFNSFVTSVYNKHVHNVAALPSVGTPPPVIPTIVTTSTGKSSSASIDTSESETVLVP